MKSFGAHYFLFLILALTLASCGTTRKATSSRSSSTSHRSTTSKSIVNDARSLIKKPYRYGGSSTKGFDCSGLVSYVFDKHHIDLPRRAADQARYGQSVKLRDVRVGDLIFFKSGGRIQHVGIVTDTRGKYPSMVHASSSKGVIEEDIDNSTYWQKRYAFVRRMK